VNVGLLIEACVAARTALTGGDAFVSREDAVAMIDEALSPKGEQVYDLTYPPSANAYWRSKTIRKGNRFIPLVHRSHEADDYRALVNKLGMINGWTARPECEVSVAVEVWRPRKIGDLDNTLKVMFDALKGRAFVDDNQVVEIYARRHDDKDNPRAVVKVQAVE
jgi:Holliday junction resolvase RusA-like endonuclease